MEGGGFNEGLNGGLEGRLDGELGGELDMRFGWRVGWRGACCGSRWLGRTVSGKVIVLCPPSNVD